MEELKLKREKNFTGRPGPLVLVIMDGMGIGKNDDNNAFFLAKTPFLDEIQREYLKKNLYVQLKAHGTAVGLPSDSEMGNSEVGHNAIGGGNVVKQRALLAKEAIESKALFQGKKWQHLASTIVKNRKTLHLIGLLSDGYVHSHFTHLIGILHGAKDSNIKKVRIHILLDGRDVPPQSSLLYIDMLEKELEKINAQGSHDYRIASGGGRMRITMDRYNSDWAMVQRGWEAHVCGFPDILPSYPGFFKTARMAVEQARSNDPTISDQYLPSFVIADVGNQAIGIMENGDGVLFFNYRGDRAIQISRAFDEGGEFDDFLKICEPNTFYYGLMQYDEKKQIPENYLIDPPILGSTFIDHLSAEKIPMYAVSETFKIGHLCYFFWGNRDMIEKTEHVKKKDYNVDFSVSKFNEDIFEIKSFPSELIEKNPKMKAFEIKEELINALKLEKYKFLRVNFTNGDMVGHTGNKEAAIIAAETVDRCVQEVVQVVNALNGIAIITSDHGNLEDMSEKWVTSHTCNPVMCAIMDSRYNDEYSINNDIKEPSLGNIASTILNLLGYESPSNYLKSLIKFRY